MKLLRSTRIQQFLRRRLGSSASSSVSPKNTEEQADTPPLPRITTRITFTFDPNSSRISSSSIPKAPLSVPQTTSLLTQITTASQSNGSTHLPRSPLNDPSPSSSNPLPPLTIEYSSPNIAKPLHMGHLRSTLTGAFIHRIASFAGHPTTSICFLGDWGRQFGILQAGLETENYNPTDFQSLTLPQLVDTYVRASKRTESDQNFLQLALQRSSDLESNDPTATSLWTHTRTLTLQHLKQAYSQLDINFDVFESESDHAMTRTPTVQALELLKSKSILTPPSPTVRAIISEKNQPVLIKSDGSSLYLLRDVSSAIQRQAYSRHQVYITDSSQAHHFQNLFAILEKLGIAELNTPDNAPSSYPPFTSTHTHVTFGRVEGMSTRKGSYTKLSDVIDDGTTLMHEKRKTSKNARNTEDMDTSRNLAISCLVINTLKLKRGKHLVFEWDQAVAEQYGIQLQYTVQRLNSLIDKFEGKHAGQAVESNDADTTERYVEICLRNPHMGTLVAAMLNFEDAFWKSYVTLEPCTLITYAQTLSERISKALSACPVLTEENDQVARAYVFAFQASNHILQACMRIVGMPRIDKGI